jgi:hypothetical protein
MMRPAAVGSVRTNSVRRAGGGVAATDCAGLRSVHSRHRGAPGAAFPSGRDTIGSARCSSRASHWRVCRITITIATTISRKFCPRLMKKKVITVILGTDYFPLDATHSHSRAYRMRIAEVENAGKPNERRRGTIMAFFGVWIRTGDFRSAMAASAWSAKVSH